MNKKRLGVFIFLFAILIISVSMVSAVDPDVNKKNTCSNTCPANNFLLTIKSITTSDTTPPNAAQKTECTKSNTDSSTTKYYYKTYTDSYIVTTKGDPAGKEVGDSASQRLYCCCQGTEIKISDKIGTGKTPFTEGRGLVDIFELDAGGIFQWFSAYEKGTDVSTVFIKYLFLVLVFVMAYSSFNIIRFPEETYLRAILSVVVAILFTIVIRPEELIAAMINFKSVGLTMILVFPMIVLAMFSFAMAVQMNAMGIVLQRVIWGIYSVFLFLNSSLVLLAGKASVAPDSVLVSLATLAGSFGGTYFAEADATIASALFVASIIIFFTMVLFNKKFIDILSAEVTNAKLLKYGNTLGKAEAKKKADADAIDNA